MTNIDTVNVNMDVNSQTGGNMNGLSTGTTQIGTVIVNPSQPVKDTRSLRGRTAYITCDRDKPAFEFRKILNKYLQDRKVGNVHFVVIHGTENDCPASFISRLRILELQFAARTLPSVRWSETPKLLDIEVKWECSPGQEPQHMLDQLQEDILFEIARSDSAPTSSSHSGGQFGDRLRRLTQKYDVLVIRHEVEAQEWHDQMKDLLKEYAALFAANAGNDTLFLLFFAVKYTWRKSDKAIRAMENALAPYLQTNSNVLFYNISRLGKVKKRDVEKLLRSMFGDSRDEQSVKVQRELYRLFWFRRSVWMKKVEQPFYS